MVFGSLSCGVGGDREGIDRQRIRAMNMITGFRKLWVWLVVLALGCLTASAHTDVVLELKDGKLVAPVEEFDTYKVPEEFLPMEYDAVTHRVRIGRREMKLIPYFTSLFPEDGKYKVRFSTSWYHDLALLPPYLQIRIEPEGRQFHYELLLNMKDLSVIYLELDLDLGGGARRCFPVDLKHWEKEIAESIKPVDAGINKERQEKKDGQREKEDEMLDPFAK